ncbi:class I adenylate-forming enzyme family protein [Bradyrhizobium sp. Ai1a-2]|uniref:class I adenylate-forming enzyme family protein n=1 Tax=Bradyrhizobium sp. Ai1a-2 TaxID=196490 RepID=UPI0003FCAAE0|nr:class I adenylate-forming enzyme family protein [Bradyrhizobium sp. Ai1a-2]
MLNRAISVSDVLRITSRATPKSIAIFDEQGSLSYSEFDKIVDRLATRLWSLGVAKGDKVAYLLWNQRELLQSYFAIGRIAALTVPLNFRLSVEEMSYQLATAQCKVIIVDEDLTDLATQAINLAGSSILQIVVGSEVKADQIAFSDAIGDDVRDIAAFPVVKGEDDSGIWFTSGTTGRPKGAVVKHRSAVATATFSAMSYGFTSEVRALAVAPLFHRGPMENIALAVVLCGGTNFLFRKLSAAQTLACLDKYKINTAFIVPTMAWQLLSDPGSKERAFPYLTNWISASAPLPAALGEQICEAFKLPNGVTNAYGITEMLFVSKCPPAMLSKKPGTVGLPAPGAQIIIYDQTRGVLPAGEVGEILVSGPTAFSHYLNNDEATQAAIIDIDGSLWYRSGDVGVIDSDGYLAIKDRLKDMIISGGENIYCAEVELALSEHPAVREVSVVGVPDEKWGEIVVAAVVASSGCNMDLGELSKSCGNLAGYKRPREVVCLDELPKNSFGKVRKDALRKIVLEKLVNTRQQLRAS